MTDLPSKGDLVNTDTLEAAYQAALGDLYDFLTQLFIGDTEGEALTISSGVITPTLGFIYADTEGAASTDNLTNISATNIGSKIIVLKATSAARKIVVKHLASGSDQIYLKTGADATLDNTDKLIVLGYNSTSSRWEELWRNWGLYLPTATDISDAKTALGLGTAATLNYGTDPDQVPKNSNLKALAYLNALTAAAQINDGIITGAKLANATIAIAKLANSTPNTFIGFNGSGVAAVFPQGTALVQREYAEYSSTANVAAATLTTSSTTGTEILSITLAGVTIGNTVAIRFRANPNRSNNISTVTKFQANLLIDAVVTKAAVATLYAAGADQQVDIGIEYQFTATATSHTIAIRVAPNSGTWQINSGNYAGNIATLIVEEYRG